MWQTYQQEGQHFRQRWSNDYLQSLQQRHRWPRKTPKLQPGELILIEEDNTTPLQWPTAVIQETRPGKNGIVGLVIVKSPKG